MSPIRGHFVTCFIAFYYQLRIKNTTSTPVLSIDSPKMLTFIQLTYRTTFFQSHKHLSLMRIKFGFVQFQFHVFWSLLFLSSSHPHIPVGRYWKILPKMRFLLLRELKAYPLLLEIKAGFVASFRFALKLRINHNMWRSWKVKNKNDPIKKTFDIIFQFFLIPFLAGMVDF